MNTLGTFRAKRSTKHVLSQDPVIGVRATAAVEGLFCTVVNTWDNGSSQIHGKGIEDQIPKIPRSAKALLVVTFPHLIMIVKHRDDMVPEPREITVIVELRISE